MGRWLRVLAMVASTDPLARLLDELRAQGFDPDCERVDTLAGLGAALERAPWDLVLARDTLPAGGAAAVLDSLRERGLDIPVLALTEARAPEARRAVLSLGAQDWIDLHAPDRLGPAAERELRAARVRAARILTEAALREAEVRYRQLVDQLPVGVHLMALDAAGSTLSISPPLERILGFSQAEWVADPQLWRRQIHPADREAALADLARVFVPGAGAAIAEYRLVTRAGAEVWLRDETLLVRDAAGRPLYLQSVKLDITERRRQDTEAQQVAQQMAGWVRELEQSRQELTLLEALGHRLQACLSPAEAYPVLADSLPSLFPDQSGALYQLEPAGGPPEQARLLLSWGPWPPEAVTFPVAACLALRRGQSALAEMPRTGLVCDHLGAATAASLCVPLTAQGETIALLQVCAHRPAGPSAPRPDLPAGKQRLAQAVAERAALVLVSLQRQVARRQPGAVEVAPGLLVAGPLRLNTRTYELTVEGRLVKPTPVEFDLLQFLMRRAGQVFTSEQLLQTVWGYPPGAGSQELVRAHIRNLRAKLEQDPRQPRFLRTKGRFGYLIALDQTAAEPAADEADDFGAAK